MKRVILQSAYRPIKRVKKNRRGCTLSVFLIIKYVYIEVLCTNELRTTNVIDVTERNWRFTVGSLK